MSLTAGIDVPINLRNKLRISGLVTSQNGSGEHAFTAALKSTISEDLNTELHLTANDNATFKLKGTKQITKQDLIGASVDFSPQLMNLFSKKIYYVHLLSKYLAFNCALKTDLIDDSSITTSLSYDKEKNRIDLEFRIGVKSSYLSLSYIRSLDLNETKLKTKLKYSLDFGPSVEYGCETKLTKNSRVDATVSFGQSNGVSVKIAIMVSNQNYGFDILLSDELILGPIVYGTVCPMIAYLCVKKYVIDRYAESTKKKMKQELSRENLKRMYERRRDAELSIQLMQDAYERSVNSEKTKVYGLVIDIAIYGNADNLQEFVNRTIRDVSTENLNLNDCDELIMRQLSVVTIPLQCLIKESILSLPDATKVSKLNLNRKFDL